MSYIKVSNQIEEASFKKIQEIIDQEHPDIVFDNPFHEAVWKRVVLRVQISITSTISNFQMMLSTIF